MARRGTWHGSADCVCVGDDAAARRVRDGQMAARIVSPLSPLSPRRPAWSQQHGVLWRCQRNITNYIICAIGLFQQGGGQSRGRFCISYCENFRKFSLTALVWPRCPAVPLRRHAGGHTSWHPDNIRQRLIRRNTKYGHLIVISVLTMLTGEMFITSSPNITAH